MADHNVPVSMSSPDLSEAEIDAAVRVLRSGRLSVGPNVSEFESRFAASVGTTHAIAVSSGTAALHLALIAAGVRDGDRVITSPLSFVATAAAITYERAIPIFVDVDPATGNLDVDAVCDLLSRSPDAPARAVLPVHLFGRPANVLALVPAARAAGVAVVEDACEALGASVDGRAVGSFGDLACFGFYANKQITTAEGGMIVTSSERHAALCRQLRNHGRDESGRVLECRPGFNYRLSDIASAIGIVQLGRLDELQKKRNAVAGWYSDRLSDVPAVVSMPPPERGVRLSWFTYVVRFDEPLLRLRAEQCLEAQGIPSRRYFEPIHLLPWCAEHFGYRRGDFPHAERLADTLLALPFSSVMTEDAVDRVCSVLRGAL